MQVPELEVLATCRTAINAFQVLQSMEVDLLLVDIKMPGLAGTDLVRSLKKPPMVIFTTAYQEHAVEGFDLNAIDYLLKPIALPRFLKAIDKVIYYFKMNGKEVTAPLPVPSMPLPAKHFLYLRIERRSVKVDTADIYWIESVKDYIKVVTKDKEYITKQKISVAEKLLPLSQFVRVHRSFIVAVNKVESYHPNHLMIAGSRVPVGRNYKQICLEKFGPEGGISIN